MALCFISHINRLGISIAADLRLMKQFNLTPTQMGAVYSTFLWVYTLCMIPGGWFIDRVGSRVALFTMGISTAVFCVLTGALGFAIAGTGIFLFALKIIRGVMGLCTTPLHPGCARAVGDWVPASSQSLANGLITGAAIFGVAATPLVFGKLIERFDWPATFVIFGLATVAIAVALFINAPKTRRVVNADATASVAQKISLSQMRSLFFLTLSYAAIGYFQYLFFYWMHFYFDDVLKVGADRSKVFAGIPPLAMAVCMPIGGWLSARSERRFGGYVGRALVPATGMLLSAVLLAIGVFAKQPGWIVFWFSLALGAAGLSEAAFWTTAVELGGARGALAAAICNTGGNAGGALAPYFTPLLSERFGWPVGIGVGGVVCLLGAACWLGIRFRASDRH